MASPNLRQIPRDKLFAIFKNEELVRLFEEILYTLNETLPADTTALEQALSEHIADTADAHQATAIGAAPGGSRLSNTVQGQLGELDAGKQAADALLAAIAALVTVADRLVYTTGVDTVALTTLTAFGRSILDDPDAATVLATLGVASAVATWLASPTSANLRAALTDETGSGAAVFATAPTLNGPTLASPTLTGTTFLEQVTPTTKGGAATLTTAELLTAIIEYTGGAATLTLPTGANIDLAIPGMVNNGAFAFTVINTGAGAVALGTAAGLTLTGSMSVAAGASGRFAARRTAVGTYTVYRIA